MAVAVINHFFNALISSFLSSFLGCAFGLMAFFSVASYAAVLPKDRVDAMYHSYDGGGVTIDGPALLIRRNVLDKFSASASVYMDNITGASIDVEILASEYKEERTEYSLGVDYLNNKTIMSLGYTNSSENDYDANTVYGTISQDFFGDLSNVSLSYSQGWDDVSKTNDSSFGTEHATHRKYVLSVSQVLSKKWLMSISLQADVDEGFLNNPYRQYSYVASDGLTRNYANEIYPGTRTSDATAIRFKYYLPYRAALGFEFRHYQDSWGIKADNYEASYTHPWGKSWIFDVHYRGYTQGRADFYSDLFETEGQQNFMARDKELSRFNTATWGGGVTFEYNPKSLGFVESLSVSLLYDRMAIKYHDFLDARENSDVGAGNESKYSIDADIVRLFISVGY